MRFISILISTCAFYLTAVTAAIFPSEPEAQHRLKERPAPLDSDGGTPVDGVPRALFADLERLARLVDITYCVGTTGISPPFSCASRCKDFPGLELASTWNTGVLMSDSCGYVAVDHGGGGRGGAVIVAFRGTYSITNTIVDLSTVPQEYVPYPEPDGGGGGDGDGEGGHRCANCTVHMGFLASWAQARRLVLPVLADIRAEHPGYPIRLVGHSLGGAVALLAGLELKVAAGWDDMVVTTFGEPQVGNEGFVGFVDRVFGLVGDDGDVGEGKGHGHEHEHGAAAPGDLEGGGRIYRRVTHIDDPVPLLPLSEWGFRSHAGEVFISKADLSPGVEDLRLCHGDDDPACISGNGADALTAAGRVKGLAEWMSREERDGDGRMGVLAGLPSRLKLWQLLFAHRDYFWRLGLCVPGGDPSDWGRPPYNVSSHPDEL
ncbi:hypothetical protein SLS53_003702 [Cytospora paraplurivora]|uniref:Fungal lipase-type domain-containing protein n=1 Tax=Cytospora paraplurivora TaxID=2898453 RepID=A0AAN9UC54_9PEZI